MLRVIYYYILKFFWQCFISLIFKWPFILLKKHVLNYKAPLQLNYLYVYGSLALFTLSLQILSGILLALRYINSVDAAFASVQTVIRVTTFGYIFQTIHSVGASLFLIILFIHLFRGLWYQLYKNSSLIWVSGVISLVLVMLAAFSGYILPWGQMSYWAATVIFNFFSIIPLVGPDIVKLLFGGEVVGQPTLSRVYVIHFLTPFIVLILVLIHICALHKQGSSITYASPSVSINLQKFIIKDLGAFSIVLLSYILIIYVYPNLFVDFLNLEHADGMVTPKHIKPEWYFMPFYGILKTIPHKTGGILCMGLSIVIFLLLPWLWKLKKYILGLVLKQWQFTRILFLKLNLFKPLIKLNLGLTYRLKQYLYTIFLIIIISLGFYNDLTPGPYYLISYFLIICFLI